MSRLETRAEGFGPCGRWQEGRDSDLVPEQGTAWTLRAGGVSPPDLLGMPLSPAFGGAQPAPWARVETPERSKGQQ